MILKKMTNLFYFRGHHNQIKKKHRSAVFHRRLKLREREGCEQGVMKTATIKFPSRDSELRFKWVLGRVSVMAKVLRDKKRITLALRPTDMQNFRENLYIRGLAHCPVTNAVLQYLQENPTEFLQFQFRV
jgi:hypothetical protein